MKLAVFLIFMVGMAAGQVSGGSANALGSGGGTITRSWHSYTQTPSSPPKSCAFGLKAQVAPGELKTKAKPPSAKDVFSESLKFTSIISLEAVYRVPPVHWSCPYERAIELFGEDRVKFEVAQGKIKRVTVDDETVYEEKP